jgi:hypothetical protein
MGGLELTESTENNYYFFVGVERPPMKNLAALSRNLDEGFDGLTSVPLNGSQKRISSLRTLCTRAKRARDKI